MKLFRGLLFLIMWTFSDAEPRLFKIDLPDSYKINDEDNIGYKFLDVDDNDLSSKDFKLTTEYILKANLMIKSKIVLKLNGGYDIKIKLNYDF